jgi:hypothetical protein
MKCIGGIGECQRGHTAAVAAKATEHPEPPNLLREQAVDGVFDRGPCLGVGIDEIVVPGG